MVGVREKDGEGPYSLGRVFECSFGPYRAFDDSA